MTKSNAPVEHHFSECILEPWVSETVLSPSASPLSRTCQGLCCVALNPPHFPPRATAGRVIGAASQQQRALFYPLPPYLLSYTPPYYPLLMPAILSTASNLIHLIKLADLEGRPLCLPIIAIAPVFSAFGKDPATKSDEFLEKFQTAFDPPSFLENYVANFL